MDNKHFVAWLKICVLVMVRAGLLIEMLIVSMVVEFDLVIKQRSLTRVFDGDDSGNGQFGGKGDDLEVEEDDSEELKKSFGFCWHL